MEETIEEKRERFTKDEKSDDMDEKGTKLEEATDNLKEDLEKDAVTDVEIKEEAPHRGDDDVERKEAPPPRGDEDDDESTSTRSSAEDDNSSSLFKSPTMMAFKLPPVVSRQPKMSDPEKKKLVGEIKWEEKVEPEDKEREKTEELEKKKKKKVEAEQSRERGAAASGKRKSGASNLTPAQKKKFESIPIPYKEPSWSGISEVPYHLEVLKMGKIVDSIELDVKPFIVFGRLPTCDVPMEHPSLSRFHAILQYRATDESPEAPEDKKKGYYLMDLGSTHGSFLNKNQVEANTYIRLKAGHMFKFGGSSRYFILQGGTEEDEEAESEFTLSQLKEMRKVREEHLKKKMADEEEREKRAKERDAKGATWGFADDATEEEQSDDDDDDDDEVIDMSKNPYGKMAGKAEHEEKYADDARKCLQNWYEREGEDLEYEFVEEGTGKKRFFFCRITLPIDSEEPVIAEGEGTNKKQAKIIAAREACKILDIRGLLFQSHQESSTERRRKKLEENDFYDSDEDEFLDRTGEIEAKRQRRMAQMGKAVEEKALTYTELVAKLDAFRDEMTEIERKLEKARKEAEDAAGAEDSLDAFMSAIKSGRSLDTKTRIKMKMRLQELKKEQLKVQRLADIARPANLPPLLKPNSSVRARGGIWVGKMGGRGRGPVMKTVPLAPTAKKGESDGEEEEEDDDDDDDDDVTAMVTGKMGDEKRDSKEEKLARNRNSIALQRPKSGESNINDSASSSSPVPVAASTSASDPPSPTPTSAEAKKKVVMKVGETKMAKNKSGIASASSATEASGMEKKSKNWGETKSSSSRGKQDLSVSSILSSRVTEAYNEERMKDPKFAMWVPPVNQAGDGKTKLNEKFGY